VADFEFDMSGMKKLYEQIEGFDQAYDTFLDKFLMKAGHRTQDMTIDLTPVGQYPLESGLKGGSLRSSWKLTPIQRKGEDRQITLYSDSSIAPYAPYVEHGHRIKKGQRFKLPDGTWRTTTKTRWWEGRHMAADSMKKTQDQLPTAFNRDFAKFIRKLGLSNG
jgi:Bacteriophage HK97-gp10, putative tail-component